MGGALEVFVAQALDLDAALVGAQVRRARWEAEAASAQLRGSAEAQLLVGVAWARCEPVCISARLSGPPYRQRTAGLDVKLNQRNTHTCMRGLA